MTSPARDGLLDLLRSRIVVAPMAGGPSTTGLVIAAARAGAHRGTFVNDDTPGGDRGLLSLIGEVATVTGLPQIAAGGIMGPRQVQGVLAAYPEINNATRPLRAAAAARGDAEGMSLWAGQGYRQAAERPAAEIIERLRG